MSRPGRNTNARARAKSIPLAGVIIGAVSVSGCQRAPSIDVFGSFFPIWMVCIIGGILMTLGARFALIRAGLEGELGPLVVVYPAMVTLLSCAIWLACFRF